MALSDNTIGRTERPNARDQVADLHLRNLSKTAKPRKAVGQRPRVNPGTTKS